VISIAMLDIGKTPETLLRNCIDFLAGQLEVNILSLPDTSGIMTPDQVYDRINAIVPMVNKTKISVHCHNDMGLAAANTYMGIRAGARVLEASALGIGERNGIADLFTTAKMLKNKGFDLGVDTDNIELFKAYYQYVDTIATAQTGESLLNYNTPFFGDAAGTHVAGTHGKTSYGLEATQNYYLNLLCGKHLVQKYLETENLSYDKNMLERITKEIKTRSAMLNRCLKKNEIAAIVDSFNKSS
ncbi:MAG: hypothetical protein GY729_14550, partial [Desulfobacteraceae bacterium]|nr:hypothetical protein [Desulfobacteraceae bacterium]